MRLRRLVGVAAIAAIVALVGQLARAQFSGVQPLTGDFGLTGAHPADPLPGEPTDSHLRMHLTGEVARALFDRLKVDAKPEACDPRPGWREKRLGQIMCSTDGRVYQCFLAINIPEQKIEGWPC
jgi:hypothetical protein